MQWPVCIPRAIILTYCLTSIYCYWYYGIDLVTIVHSNYLTIIVFIGIDYYWLRPLEYCDIDIIVFPLFYSYWRLLLSMTVIGIVTGNAILTIGISIVEEVFTTVYITTDDLPYSHDIVIVMMLADYSDVIDLLTWYLVTDGVTWPVVFWYCIDPLSYDAIGIVHDWWMVTWLLWWLTDDGITGMTWWRITWLLFITSLLWYSITLWPCASIGIVIMMILFCYWFSIYSLCDEVTLVMMMQWRYSVQPHYYWLSMKPFFDIYEEAVLQWLLLLVLLTKWHYWTYHYYDYCCDWRPWRRGDCVDGDTLFLFSYGVMMTGSDDVMTDPVKALTVPREYWPDFNCGLLLQWTTCSYCVTGLHCIVLLLLLSGLLTDRR